MKQVTKKTACSSDEPRPPSSLCHPYPAQLARGWHTNTQMQDPIDIIFSSLPVPSPVSRFLTTIVA